MAVRLSSKSYNDLLPVLGINAALHFEIGGKLSSIKCQNNEVYLRLNGENIIRGKKIDVGSQTNTPSLGELLPLKEALPLLRQLFFTIVNNYSFHSYNAKDFRCECGDKDQIWINGLFHKNDGYLTPLVLNPFRNNGILNMERETYLTNSRLASMLYMFKKEGSDFIDDYELKSLSFFLKRERIDEKLKYNPKIKGTISKHERIKHFNVKTTRQEYLQCNVETLFRKCVIR